MKPSKWYLWLTLLLLLVSAAFYALQLAVFRKPHDTFFYMLQDLAFVPIQVLLVTLILNDLMARRERKQLLQKMNMVIGSFFSEMGSELITALSAYDTNFDLLRRTIKLDSTWKQDEFRTARDKVNSLHHAIDSRQADLSSLKALLLEKRGFVLGLLENQNLLEHQTFTDLLWASTHLNEELQFRPKLSGLPDADYQHLSGDIKRVYALLLAEWLEYANHLRRAYPYMYSLVVRRNPFNEENSAVVK
jgi:signal transduction histidine kinase